MSRASAPREREQGVVLLLVLVILVASISTVYAFTRTTTLEVFASRHRGDRVRAELLARSAEAIAVQALLDDLELGDDVTLAVESGEDAWALLGAEPIEVPGGGVLRIRIRDAAARINLNGLFDADGNAQPETRPFLRAALERIIDDMPGRQEEKLYDPDDLADAIIDWVDSNTTTERFGDDEVDYYTDALRSEALPLDRPLLALDELAGVPGMDPLLLRALAAYFTPHPMYGEASGGGLNPNTAEPHVLGLIYHGQGDAEDGQLFGRDDVFRVLRLREDGIVFCAEGTSEECASLEQELDIFGELVFPPLRYASDVFTIRTEARFGETRACLTSVVDRARQEIERTLEYRLDC